MSRREGVSPAVPGPERPRRGDDPATAPGRLPAASCGLVALALLALITDSAAYEALASSFVYLAARGGNA